MNSIAQVKTMAVDGPNGPATAMMIAVDIDDPQSAEGFVSQVMEEFKLKRMVAPPDTSLLLITLIGEMSAERFAARWKALAGQDEIIRAFLSLMTIAEVVQGTKSGQELSKASLR